MGEKLVLLMLGLVQGLTDIFPISSTGHLAILTQVLNIRSLNLSVVAGLHSGSLIAIVIFFKKELWVLWRDFLGSLQIIRRNMSPKASRAVLPVENLTPYLYASSLLPVAIIGLIFRETARLAFSQEMLPVLLLSLNGGVILITTLVAKGERAIKELTLKEFLVIGAVQGIAVLPGISRLGLVLCTGLLFRLKWQDALKLTFILSIPVVIGALIIEFGNILITIQNSPGLITPFMGGCVLAGVGSWFSLNILTSKLLERKKMNLFGIYCLMLSIFSLAYLYFWK